MPQKPKKKPCGGGTGIDVPSKIRKRSSRILLDRRNAGRQGGVVDNGDTDHPVSPSGAAATKNTGRRPYPCMGGDRCQDDTTLDDEMECLSWIDDYDAVTTHLATHGDLEERVRDHGGLLRISNFLPRNIARFIYKTLKNIPDTSWIQTSAEEDVEKNNIRHCFYSCKKAGGDGHHLDLILRLFSVIFPDSLSVFSAAKYVGNDSHCIERHDDRAYVPVKMEDTGKTIMCCRKMALVYYLGDGDQQPWDGKTMGGMFIDCEDDASTQGQREYVPEFNSLVLFEIPRYHIVTKVQPLFNRFSIFGWTLEPGTSLYTLHHMDNID